MSTTLTGDLHGTDTKDTSELSRKARKYTYRVSASGGGTVRLKIDYLIPGQIGLDGDTIDSKWKNLVPRFKTDSGQTTSGRFSLPKVNDEGKTMMKVIFSRGIGTKGVNYEFYMEPA